jgi:hypothetical protein
MDYAALKSELENDPEDLGYAPLLASGSDTLLAELLNEPEFADVEVKRLEKNEFLLAITPALLRVASKTEAIQTKWDRIFNHAQAALSFDVADERIQTLLALAVGDGLLTQEEVDAISTKQGSRAEALFGHRTVVTTDDIAVALRNT